MGGGGWWLRCPVRYGGRTVSALLGETAGLKGMEWGVASDTSVVPQGRVTR
jgi:hypothetical protein